MGTRRISQINKRNDESEKSKLLSEPLEVEAELPAEAAAVLAVPVHLLVAVVVVVRSETAAEVKSERTVRLICCTVLG